MIFLKVVEKAVNRMLEHKADYQKILKRAADIQNRKNNRMDILR